MGTAAASEAPAEGQLSKAQATEQAGQQSSPTRERIHSNEMTSGHSHFGSGDQSAFKKVPKTNVPGLQTQGHP